ncbi:MAG: hypothetical protein R3F19_00940 [Verrucomicrobiales bacterium]
MKSRAIFLWSILCLGLTDAAPPPNDFFVDRVTLPSEVPVVTTGDLAEATTELSEPPHLYLAVGRDLSSRTAWWSWVAPSSDWFAISSLGDNRNLFTSVYAGSRVDSLQMVGLTSERLSLEWNESDATTVHFLAKSGTEYQICVGGLYPQSDSVEPSIPVDSEVRIAIEAVPSPGANANFEDRLDLGNARNISVPGNLLGSTVEPVGPGGTEQKSVWYEWVAPEDGLFQLGNHLSVSVYQGNTLRKLGKIDPIGRIEGGISAYRFVAGQSYKIAILDARDATRPDDRLSAPFRLEIHPFEVASNGDFANAIDLGSTEGIMIEGNNIGVAKNPELDEPNHIYRGREFPNHSLWWKWTAPRTVTYTGPGDYYTEARPFVYQGNSLAELLPVTSLTFTAGEEYYFAVAADEFSAPQSFQFLIGSDGETTLHNDAFADAIDLGEKLIAQFTGTYLQPTLEPQEPSVPQALGSLWWRWTAPATGWFSFSVDSDSWIKLSNRVYSGTKVALLNPVYLNSGSYDGVARPCYFKASIGEQFYLAVYETTSSGPIENTIRGRIEHLPIAGNDAFEHAIDLGAQERVEQSFASPEAKWDEQEPGGPREHGTLLWWRWTAPADGSALLRLRYQRDRTTKVFTGQGLTDLKSVVLSDLGILQEWWGSSQALTFETKAGAEYWLAVGNDRGVAIDSEDWTAENDPWAHSVFQLELVRPPSNDNLEDATDLGNGHIVQAWSTGLLATREPDEPMGIAKEKKGTLWWTWTAPSTGTYWINDIGMRDTNTCEVFSDTGDGSLQPIRTGFRRVRRVTSSISGCLLQAKGGVRYTIKLGTDEQGPVRLLIQEASTFENDFFDDAIDLGRVRAATSQVSGYDASTELDEPFASTTARPDFVDGAIWWRWTAPTTEAYSIKLSAKHESNMEILQGDQLGDLRRIALEKGAHDSPMVQVTIDATEGDEFVFAWRRVDFSNYRRQVTLEIVPEKIDVFEKWILQFSALTFEQQSPEANPTGDGISNLLKFLFNLDPTRSLSNPAYSLDTLSFPQVTISGNGCVSVEYRVSSEAVRAILNGEIREVLQSSVNGKEWADVPEEARRSSAQGIRQIWDIPNDDNVPQMFFRVKIELTH